MMRILITDDHGLVRSGLRALLSTHPEFEVVGEATDGVTVVETCRRTAPDVVLMDLSMPGRGGVAAIRDLRQEFPEIQVVVVTVHEDVVYARQAILAGATGYVLKKSLADDLVRALRTVRGGGLFVPPGLASNPPAADPAGGAARPRRGGPEALTHREREILTLVALGYTTSEIARRVHIGDKTVESHRKNISEKLRLRTRADLVRFALDYRLIGA